MSWHAKTMAHELSEGSSARCFCSELQKQQYEQCTNQSFVFRHNHATGNAILSNQRESQTLHQNHDFVILNIHGMTDATISEINKWDS